MWYKLAQELVPEESEAVFDPIQNKKTNTKNNTDNIVNNYFQKYKTKILNTPLPSENAKAIISWAKKSYQQNNLIGVDSYDGSKWEDIRKIRKFELDTANYYQYINFDILSSYPNIFNEISQLTKNIIQKLNTDKDINNYLQKLNSILFKLQENQEPLPVDTELISRIWENPRLSLPEKYQFLQKHFGNTDIWKQFKNILPKGLGI